MNWLDLILIGLILLEAVLGWRQGFVRSSLGLVTWLGGLLLAFLLYTPLAAWLAAATGLSEIWARPAAFLAVTFAGIIVLRVLAGLAVRRVPGAFHRGAFNRLLGLVPGLINGLVTATIAALLLLTLPLPAPVATAAQDSRLSDFLSVQTQQVQGAMERVFGQAVSRALTITTIPPGSEERKELPFTVTAAAVRPDLEAEMLSLVNAERTKAGLRPLASDDALREVARRHSADMFARGYFGHISQEGKDPFDRIRESGITFLAAGENLALAPTLSLAHSGLMNSPGHRANILRPQFGRLGIGIVDGGRYGVMITQLFRD